MNWACDMSGITSRASRAKTVPMSQGQAGKELLKSRISDNRFSGSVDVDMRREMRRHLFLRTLPFLATALMVLFTVSLHVSAEPIPAAQKQGSMHGFLLLKSADGKVIAIGDQVNVVLGVRDMLFAGLPLSSRINRRRNLHLSPALGL
jgi:hypothetical protein